MNIKFRMPKFGQDLKLTGMTKELTMSTVGTTISIILTFGTAHWLEQRNAEQARKLLAMTIIYDIDESIDVVKKMKAAEENGSAVTRFLIENINGLDTISSDILFEFFNYVSNGSISSGLDFNKSNENIFNSSQDSWRALDDRLFINNVQSFYHVRSTLERIMSELMYFRKPIFGDELYEYTMGTKLLDDNTKIHALFRQLLMSERVQRYVETSMNRISFYQQFLDLSIGSNEENKFLMNITDEDMQEFINTTIKKVRAATEKDIIGTWTGIVADNQNIEYEFHKDHTLYMRHTIFFQHPLYYGRMAVNYTGSGKWAEENDSLVTYFDESSLKIEVDENGITYQPEKVDSIRAIKNQICSEESRNAYLAPIATNNRQPRASNIDRTGKRLELTNPEGRTTHYQRKEDTKE